MRRSRAIFLAAIALAAAVTCWSAAPAMACPNCKQTIADDAVPGRAAAQGQAAAAGYNYSIFVMLGTLYLTVGTFIGAGIYYLRKNSANVNRT